MRYAHVCLEALGYHLPPLAMSSAALEDRLAPLYEKLKLPFGRLEMMSGIRERRFWDHGTRSSQVSAEAGRAALAKAGIQPGEIDCLFHCSVCRDFMEPATASVVHGELGLASTATIYDISNACLGFLNGIVSVANMIELGQIKNGLVVAGEGSRELVESTIQSLLDDPAPRREAVKRAFASLTLGSGACAAVLTHDSVSRCRHRLLGGAVRCATQFSHLCRGNLDQMQTDSEALLHAGCDLARQTWAQFREVLNWSNEAVNRVFCHQVGSAHRKLLLGSLALEMDKDFSTVEFLGNMGSVSLPITMALGLERQPARAGEKIALLGIGSGLNCLMLGLEW